MTWSLLFGCDSLNSENCLVDECAAADESRRSARCQQQESHTGGISFLRRMLSLSCAVIQRNLARKGFKEQPVPGDNNCQFHALARQLEQVQPACCLSERACLLAASQNGQPGWNALSLRRQIVNWLLTNTQNGEAEHECAQQTGR